MTAVLGLLAVVLLWWQGRAYGKASPQVMARAARQAGGIMALAAAGLLMLRGRIEFALPLGALGAGLLGVRGFGMPDWARRTTATPGAQSRVRSALLEMMLDHDTGALKGIVLAGAFEGRDLDGLDEAELARLAQSCRQQDEDGLRLLEAYLDRRFPGRREAAQADAHARPGPPAQPGAMSEQEAYEVLGLAAGSGEDEIRGAHRALMKKLHPDQGGSTYLAARVNQAKDVLLSRHR